jgi:hypothetical protein
MSSICDALVALDAAAQAVGGLDWEAVAVRERLEALDRLETVRRRAGAAALDLLGSIERSKDPALGGLPPKSSPTSCASPPPKLAAESATPASYTTAPA